VYTRILHYLHLEEVLEWLLVLPSCRLGFVDARCAVVLVRVVLVLVVVVVVVFAVAVAVAVACACDCGCCCDGN